MELDELAFMPNLALAALTSVGDSSNESVEMIADLTLAIFTVLPPWPLELDMFARNFFSEILSGFALNQDASRTGMVSLCACKTDAGVSPLLVLSAASFNRPAMCAPDKGGMLDASNSRQISAAS